jgi:hypothetical protein
MAGAVQRRAFDHARVQGEPSHRSAAFARYAAEKYATAAEFDRAAAPLFLAQHDQRFLALVREEAARITAGRCPACDAGVGEIDRCQLRPAP